MDNIQILKNKLESFIRKFYLNQLLKGLIFFFAIGVLYFLITIFIEYLLWLSPLGRTILFWSFVVVEVFLFGRFIVFPLLKIFKISRGIDYTQASLIIGKHFPEVNDKLLNLLQLQTDSKQSDLLLASIDQKASDLKPVPFSLAVDYRKNLPFLKYAAVPFLIILLIFFSGNEEVFSSSYKRVVNYKMAYEPPAPFHFRLQNEHLKVRQNEDLTLKISSEGKVLPERVSIHFDNETYYMNSVSPGEFEYTFQDVNKPFDFRVSGNGIFSPNFSVEVVEVPRLQNIRMELQFPKHTQLGQEVIEGTGDAVVPEGTVVKWTLNTAATEEVEFQEEDTVINFKKSRNLFSLEKQLRNDISYAISTSNEEVRNFENLNYRIKTIEDEYPSLELEHRMDSLSGEAHYFRGEVSDDYGISTVQLVAYPVKDPKKQILRKISGRMGAVGQFIAAFPDTLSLEKGVSYEFFFEVFDNDGVNGSKSVKSEIFSFRRKTNEELADERLDMQKEAIQEIGSSLEDLEESKKELGDLQRLEKEKSELNYNDRKKLEDFLKRQKQQAQLMKNFSKKLKETLEKEENSHNPGERDELQKRLEKKEEQLQKNEDLLKELEEYSKKINDEGLNEKLDKLSKNSEMNQRNLEQLLELTKRYYVQEKTQQISNKLNDLGKEQEELSEKENSLKEQNELNEKTEEVLEELDQLRKENQKLKNPMTDVGEKEAEKEISEGQKEASEELQKGKKEEAKKKQKETGQKMQELSQKMKKQNQAGEMKQISEDAEMLRQILDNLLTFSFEQEKVMERFREMKNNSPKFSSELRRQNVLKEHFQHIDDSLYSLAMRNPMITETINEKISDVDYNLEKALERLAQNELAQGVGSQQYVVTGANELALFLNQALKNMEQMMNMGSGQGGGGKGMQLPDIIKKQGELNEEMQKGMQKHGQQGEKQDGQNGKEGNSEEGSGELFEIFKQQQMLRRALEEQLNKDGGQGTGDQLKKEMEKVEQELLEKGFDQELYERMLQLEHNLLEYEEGRVEQGKKRERESETNKIEYVNPAKNQILKAKEYFNSTEILNRQTLPLRQIYKQKVKEYFERGNH